MLVLLNFNAVQKVLNVSAIHALQLLRIKSCLELRFLDTIAVLLPVLVLRGMNLLLCHLTEVEIHYQEKQGCGW